MSISCFFSFRFSRAELEEFEKTISNLDFVQTKLTSLYNLSPDLDNISSPTEVDSGSPLRPKLHDASTPLSPQMKWNIINKSSKYSPKYNGNPDEMPLRSDESHLLARALYRLSLFVNDRLRIEERHGRGGFVGSLLGLICEPETKYREYERHGESRLVSLPPRIMLRPLASHRNLAYILIALFLGWLLGSGFTLKVLLIVAITLGIKMFFSANSAEEKYSRQEETPAKRGPTITVSGDSFDERKNN